MEKGEKSLKEELEELKKKNNDLKYERDKAINKVIDIEDWLWIVGSIAGLGFIGWLIELFFGAIF